MSQAEFQSEFQSKFHSEFQFASQHVAVIGAGWAGCAAATELAARGRQVTLFEAARIPGGRARKVMLNGCVVDNGQHILLGAYDETLRLMQMVGIDLDVALLRLPLQMRYPNNTGIDFIASKLPAPLHLLAGMVRATGLLLADKLALASFSYSAHKIDWMLEQDCSVTELLYRFRQTDRLIQFLWRPLCLAALNTPPDEASAQLFLNVLEDSLGARYASSEMLLPKLDLSALFPQQAIDYVTAHGGQVHFGARIRSLQRHDGSTWQLSTTTNAVDLQKFDQVIIATDLQNAAALLAPLTAQEIMPTVAYQPITTCYVQYGADCRLDAAFYALADDPAMGHWGQFVFDRGWLNVAQHGLFAVVISAASPAVNQDNALLCTAICNQLARVFDRAELAHPLWSKVVSEKRATFSCTPKLIRPRNKTDIRGIVLAGDYTASRYPATLEAAVRSGVAAARAVIGQ